MTQTPEPAPDDFQLLSRDKLRYGDTDRQGHVNNAVFSTLLETGRVELLFDAASPLRENGASYVIARLELDFRAELRWPGEVQIGTSVARVGRSSLTLRQAIFHNGRCVATGISVLVLMDEETRRSRPISEAALAYLQSVAA